MLNKHLGSIGLGVLALWGGLHFGLQDGLHRRLARAFGTQVNGQVKQSFVSKGGDDFGGYRHHVNAQFQHSEDEAVTATVPVSEATFARYGRDWTPAKLHYFRAFKDYPVIEDDHSLASGHSLAAVGFTLAGAMMIFAATRGLLRGRGAHV